MLDFGFYNMDCMEGMKQFPDKYFDLAIVDPPYGDGGMTGRTEQGSVKDLTVTKGGAHTTPLAQGRNTQPTRTGGTWATKFGKKL